MKSIGRALAIIILIAALIGMVVWYTMKMVAYGIFAFLIAMVVMSLIALVKSALKPKQP
ncbi:MAG: hypothetical protein Q7V63_01210 [Gammaproteobacteria bacterium]|nr:hypothetical protein [Gammaproteobacteria bacterium]